MHPTQRRMALAQVFTSRVAASHPSLTHLEDSRAFFAKRTYTATQVRRMALFALGAAALVSATLVLHAAFFSSPAPVATASQSALHMHPLYNAALHARRLDQPKTAHVPRAEFQFAAPADELGALVGFMAAFSSNALPASVDPAAPLDPDLVLGFDARDPALRGEIREAVREAWRTNPVVILSELKRGSPPQSREMKGAILALNLYPDPTIIEVDQRTDSEVTIPLLKRLTGAEQLPVAIIGGNPIRSIHEFRDLVKSGALNEMVAASGAKINGKKVKHGRKH